MAKVRFGGGAVSSSAPLAIFWRASCQQQAGPIATLLEEECSPKQTGCARLLARFCCVLASAMREAVQPQCRHRISYSESSCRPEVVSSKVCPPITRTQLRLMIIPMPDSMLDSMLDAMLDSMPDSMLDPMLDTMLDSMPDSTQDSTLDSTLNSMPCSMPDSQSPIPYLIHAGFHA